RKKIAGGGGGGLAGGGGDGVAAAAWTSRHDAERRCADRRRHGEVDGRYDTHEGAGPGEVVAAESGRGDGPTRPGTSGGWYCLLDASDQVRRVHGAARQPEVVAVDLGELHKNIRVRSDEGRPRAVRTIVVQLREGVEDQVGADTDLRESVVRDVHQQVIEDGVGGVEHADHPSSAVDNVRPGRSTRLSG